MTETQKERIIRHYRRMVTCIDQSTPRNPVLLLEHLNRIYGESKLSTQIVKAVSSHAIFQSQTSNIDNSEEQFVSLERMMANLVEQKEPDLQAFLIATLSILTGSILVKENDDEPKLGKGESLLKLISCNRDAVEDIPGLPVGSVLSLLIPLEETRGPFVIESSILSYLGNAAAVYEERMELQNMRLQDITVGLLAETAEDAEASSCISLAAFDHILSAVTTGDDDDFSAEEGALQLAQAAMDSSESDDSDSAEPQVEQEDFSDSDSDDEGDVAEDDDMLRQALAMSLVGHGLDDDSEEEKEEELLRSQMPELEEAVSKDLPEAEDGANLPPFPEPPSFYPYSIFSEDDKEDAAIYVDPTSLSKFGSIPASRVMVHTLRNALSTILNECSSSLSQTAESPSIPGGMGFSLFMAQPEEAKKKVDNNFAASALSIQLLVATLLIMAENRDTSIDGLKQAILDQQQVVETKDEPLSDEEDDPLAIGAVAMASVASLTESLETKGMRRKAAAAADDAANRLKSLRKKIDAWKDRIKMYSHCTFITLRCLKHYLQGVVSTWLANRGLSAVDIHEFLPPSVCSKLSTSLVRLMAVKLTRSSAIFSNGDESNELEDLLMPLRIYHEAVMVWGESIPFLYPSKTSRSELLNSLIVKCSDFGTSVSLVNSLIIPSTESEAQLHQLQSLCKRLCVSDLMDDFVDHPIPFTTDDASDVKEEKEDPARVSHLVTLLSSSCTALQDSGNIRSLHLAICHRMNLRGLLWDGLYTIPCDETRDVTSSLPQFLAVSTAETVRVLQSPSNNLVFDSLKCSDSIAILSNQTQSDGVSSVNGSSAHQRASKVWGTVLSSSHFSPKTGIHRWAVRLDKCERGHVFVGVATSQASTRTYVGGDKNGWGVIGTQALWHDRRKIRGDYGATFRTGSTIIITLDTDAGTISYSSWKDSSGPSSAFSFDPLLASPRRQGQSLSGTVEEWGVAFEGLPLDSKLYPAVGLYQRDDRVTILHVESCTRTSSRDCILDEVFLGGSCYYPLNLNPSKDQVHLLARLDSVKRHNDLFSLDTLQYAVDTMQTPSKCLQTSTTLEEIFVSAILPSVAASLCLLPSTIPILSQRLALLLLPHVTRCIQALEIHSKDSNLFDRGLMEGKWLIRATGSSGISPTTDCEEYVVDLKSYSEKEKVVGFQGCGIGTTGRSKNGLVRIAGTVYGSWLHFAEEWTCVSDEPESSVDDIASSCLVSARLSLDGNKFEGTYRDIQFGTTGHIAGVLSSPKSDEPKSNSLICLALLCLAHGHLVSIVSESFAGDLDSPDAPGSPGLTRELLEDTLSSHLLSYGLIDNDHSQVKNASVALQELYSYSPLSTEKNELGNFVYPNLLEGAPFDCDNKQKDTSALLLTNISALEEECTCRNGGKGSLATICPTEYSNARHHLIACFLHHTHLDLNSNTEQLDVLWRVALRTMEDGLRAALIAADSKSRKERALQFCKHYINATLFLLQVEPNPETMSSSPDKIISEVTSFCSVFNCKSDLDLLRLKMHKATKRALLRKLAFQQVISLIHHISSYSHSISARLIAIDCVATSVPRLLGRVFNATSREEHGGRVDNGRKEVIDLGVYFLSGLSGAGLATMNEIRESAHSLLRQLVLTAKGIGEYTHTSSCESFSLSLLACFMLSFRPIDNIPIAKESGILSVLPLYLKTHQNSLALTDSAWSQTSEFLRVASLNDVAKEDVARSVLMATVTVMHVLTFQITQLCDPDSIASSKECESILLNELKETIPFLDVMMEKNILLYEDQQSEDQYASWLKVCLHGSSSKSSDLLPMKRKINAKQSISGLSSLLQSGTFAGPSASQSKLSRSSKLSNQVSSISTSHSSRSDDFLMMLGNPAQQYLSQLLHVLSCLVKSPFLPVLLSEPTWIGVLLGAVGIHTFVPILINDSARATSNTFHPLPGRYRARILRLCAPLLLRSEPDMNVVHGLFMLAGTASTMTSTNLDDDDAFVSSEAISLLRNLHARSWRKTVEKVIQRHLNTKKTLSSSDPSVVGIVLFVSGKIETIRRGSHILIKPAVAALLSPDLQSTPSSKSHNNTASNNANISNALAPHHLVGNGTEGIVAGLCRMDASAGIVSSIDMQTGICEIILMERQREVEDVVILPLRHSKGGSNRYSPSLTVRALRTPLALVALAEEMPLFLDESFPYEGYLSKLLPAAIQVVDLSLRIDNEGDKTRHTQTARTFESVNGFAVHVLRASIVLLSDERILGCFLQECSSSTVLSQLLSLASKERSAINSPRSDSLSALASHEAKFSFYTSMIREITVRKALLACTTDVRWSRRHDEFNTLGDTGSEPVSMENETMLSGTVAGSPFLTTQSVPFSCTNTISPGSTDPDHNTTSSGRVVSQSSFSTNCTEDDDENEAATTAAAHLREAAIAQMAELGLPRSWSELALRRTGGTNIESAVHFCLERGGDMERLLAEEREREHVVHRQPSISSSRRRSTRTDSSSPNHLIRQLLEMGFPSRWCTEALTATRNNVDEALTWILANGERLSAEDEGMDEEASEGDEDLDDSVEEDSGEDEDTEEVEGSPTRDEQFTAPVHHEEGKNEGNAHLLLKSAQPTDKGLPSISRQTESDVHTSQKESQSKVAEDNNGSLKGWSGLVTPLRFISGRSKIDPRTLAISGLPNGGFSSVGTKGVLLTSGKWYYEAILETAGCLQIGWADGSFAGHCHADRGDGCGDGPSSWAFDGWRRYRWHASATEWGCRWKEGDVVGCMVDMDTYRISFTMNGQGEEIGMGEAFSGKGFRPCGGVYACVSFNRREKLRLILGGEGTESFVFPPPQGYKGVGEAVQSAVQERQDLVSKEAILNSRSENKPEDSTKLLRFLCDFSDGEHGHELFAWQHRYYGSDASVHLGSGNNPKQSGVNSKSSNGNGTNRDLCVVECVSRQLEKQWSKKILVEDSSEQGANFAKSCMLDAYDDMAKSTCSTLAELQVSLGTFYSQKLLLHLIVVLGERFDLNYFIHHTTGTLSDVHDINKALQLWEVLDSCVSLRAAGWVGEAGAMAIAAEALGLGISSNDHQHGHHVVSSDQHKSGLLASVDEPFLVPVAGLSQLLNSVLLSNAPKSVTVIRHTGESLAACAEAAIGAEGGGGPLVFLQKGLQSAASKSEAFREVLVTAVRRSVRQLAVIEFSGDDSALSEGADDDEMNTSTGTLDKSKAEEDDHDKSFQPDARLLSFFSGLLLSNPVQASVQNKSSLLQSLFEAWSIGLLSASAPWRMVCALSASAILNMAPEAFVGAINSIPSLGKFFSRFPGTVARRVWAERAAMPICSRYVQSYIELLASVQRAIVVMQPPVSFLHDWERIQVDAAMPIPLKDSSMLNVEIDPNELNWECGDGWLSNDTAWEVWSGVAEFIVGDWKSPSRSAVRTLMDGGEGPPLLREGCTVMRGLDWDDDRSGSVDGDEDGKSQYETEKDERESEKKAQDEQVADETDPAAPSLPALDDDQVPSTDSIVQEGKIDAFAESDDKSQGECISYFEPSLAKKKKRKKIANPKLATGSVLSIEEWNGVPAMGRRVRWDRTGKEGVYRYGGDGGKYDICQIETNEKRTRVRKRYPLPESSEQCASRHGFGAGKKYSILLRLRGTDEVFFDEKTKKYRREGVLEWPDFGAGIRVDCVLSLDGSVALQEKELLFGSKDSGWEARFGQPSYVPNTTIILRPVTTAMSTQDQADIDAKSSFFSMYEEVCGTSSHVVQHLRNRPDGGRVMVTTEFTLLRGRRLGEVGMISDLTVCPPPIRFDQDCHAGSMSLSSDGRTLTCVSADGRGTAFASTGFTKGVHYWEVKLEQADIGSVFIGVAEKPIGSGSGSSFGNDSPPRLNRWLGWGFVNFRATYTSGAERVYGAHCHNDDTVGVLLDCDAGRISFFYDGLKYGEHILSDLGCAFENISPFGFNADGCGSGGAGQGAPSALEGGRGGRYPAHGAVRPRALWPVIGLRNPGDRVTFSTKWMTSLGVDSSTTLHNILSVDKILSHYDLNSTRNLDFPEWFLQEAFQEFKRWEKGRWLRTETRASGPHRLASFGLDIEVDATPLACAAACAGLGLRYALLHGDRVVVKRSAGRILELSEEAVILGAYQGRLFYRIVSQKSEGGSLTEGGGRAWFWDESETVNDSLKLVGPGRGLDIDLPLIDCFTCVSSGGLRIVYEGGAVVRSDIEIFDRSENVGSISQGTVIPQEDVLERRVNSCGVVRYRIRCEGVGEGWISSRIRGGKEEPIVELVHGEPGMVEIERKFPTPIHSARTWYETYKVAASSNNLKGVLYGESVYEEMFTIKDCNEFKEVISEQPQNMSMFTLDKMVASLVGVIADFSESGDAVECSFEETVTVVSYAIASAENTQVGFESTGNPCANEAAAAILSVCSDSLSIKLILARMAILRAFNRRIRLALPWLSIRPSQEGTSILGGLCGHGASAERAGRQKNSKSMDLWVQVPSIASRFRANRGLIFGSVKRLLLDSITSATTTPTPLSHDEYELPREIRTVRVNRLKARRAMASSDNLTKRKHSVFSQLQNEIRSWGGAALRRGFVAKGHGGQKRAFKVKLVGEGVNDYSGPYREVFTDAIHEVLEAGENGLGVLDVLDPTPNKACQLGDNRDLHMFSRGDPDFGTNDESWRSDEELRIKRSFSILTTSRDESSREVGESLAFLGRLVGTACRHGIPVDLPLPMNTVWKAIVEEMTDEIESLREIDLLASRQCSGIPLDNPSLLQWQRRMLNSFVDGMSNVLPLEILTLLSGEELRVIICGNPDVDVDLLKRVVEYEGYKESDDVITFFWESLREMTADERKLFLQFVWARSRLPNKESDFEAPFKIMKGSEKSSDETLPSASTCFFSLTLPCYSSKEILQRKLLYAIENVCTMESDYVTNDAEVGEGWRGL